jgi:hypothetical protein
VADHWRGFSALMITGAVRLGTFLTPHPFWSHPTPLICHRSASSGQFRAGFALFSL